VSAAEKVVEGKTANGNLNAMCSFRDRHVKEQGGEAEALTRFSSGRLRVAARRAARCIAMNPDKSRRRALASTSNRNVEGRRD